MHMNKRRLRQNIRRNVDHLMRRSGQEFSDKQKKLVYSVVEKSVTDMIDYNQDQEEVKRKKSQAEQELDEIKKALQVIKNLS